jgi:hypothetical protein
MRRTRAVGAVVVLFGAAALTAPAWADGGSTTATDGGSTISVGASGPTSPTGPGHLPVGGGPSGASTNNCHYTPMPAQQAAAFGAGGPTPGGWWFVSCAGRKLTIFTGVLIWIPTGAAVSTAPAPVSPAALAAQARDSLTLPAPAIDYSPAPFGVVNFETWLWVGPAQWVPFTASASAGGVTATATAVPQSVTWTTGDGAQFVCDGPGNAYQPAAPPDTQSPSCGHTYSTPSVGQPSQDGDPNDGAYPVTATILWSISWSSSGATGGGQLAPLFTSATIPLRVEQVESVGIAG